MEGKVNSIIKLIRGPSPPRHSRLSPFCYPSPLLNCSASFNCPFILAVARPKIGPQARKFPPLHFATDDQETTSMTVAVVWLQTRRVFDQNKLISLAFDSVPLMMNDSILCCFLLPVCTLFRPALSSSLCSTFRTFTIYFDLFPISFIIFSQIPCETNQLATKGSYSRGSRPRGGNEE